MQPEEQSLPFVFNSPHSGRHYPDAFILASLLDEHEIRQSEDYFVDALFMPAVDIGAPLMCANYARAFLDVNREPYELDAKMFADKLPDYVNTRSLRVAGGLGTVARIVADRKEIYRGKLDVGEVMERIEKIYKPYHQALRNVLARTHVKFGYAVLVDCHSMPSAKENNARDLRPDFVIGDRYGTSSAREIVHSATTILRDLGYRVEVNKPYAGGFITEHYGRPGEGLHTLQVEINRSIYMDEKAIKTNDRFEDVRQDLSEFIRQLVSICGDELGGQFALAAE